MSEMLYSLPWQNIHIFRLKDIYAPFCNRAVKRDFIRASLSIPQFQRNVKEKIQCPGYLCGALKKLSSHKVQKQKTPRGERRFLLGYRDCWGCPFCIGVVYKTARGCYSIRSTVISYPSNVLISWSHTENPLKIHFLHFASAPEKFVILYDFFQISLLDLCMCIKMQNFAEKLLIFSEKLVK